MVEADSFLHLARPLGPAAVGSQPTTAPLNVVIQPQVCCIGSERIMIKSDRVTRRYFLYLIIPFGEMQTKNV